MKRKIQVILKKDNFKEEKKGKIITVFPGYAFNYLIPKGIAEIATKNCIKHYQMFSEIEKKKQEENLIAIQKIKNIAKQINKITVYKKIGSNNLIFGSIKEKDIANWIYLNTNLNIDKKQITLESINKIGINSISIELKQNISITLKLCIIPYNI